MIQRPQVRLQEGVERLVRWDHLVDIGFESDLDDYRTDNEEGDQ